jgi:hypothetical protein
MIRFAGRVKNLELSVVASPPRTIRVDPAKWPSRPRETHRLTERMRGRTVPAPRYRHQYGR